MVIWCIVCVAVCRGEKWKYWTQLWTFPCRRSPNCCTSWPYTRLHV